VPAVLIGSLLSSRAPDKYIRPVITFVIFASGLKYVGLSTAALGWSLCGVLLAGAGAWVLFCRPGARVPEDAAAAAQPLSALTLPPQPHVPPAQPDSGG
jgi:hypothetical protein